MFVVLEGGIPARFPEHSVDETWIKYEYDTFEEALVYANNWLGEYGPCGLTEPGTFKFGMIDGDITIEERK